ncbi:hypothetical protein [Actinoplanes sp. M2I2]|uniref:hypothetical protein n=1 Tax=Actinoplanes sp. M2I2 TaxID=1734444 RepID=UPI002022451B|nr:hypothetical protein [Actinoplanes sp. M2I2]
MNGDDARPERGSWRVVWRALRVGHVDDPRFEALTRQAADRNVRNGWLLGFLAVMLVFQAGLFIAKVVRGTDGLELAFAALVVVLAAVGVGVSWVARRRSRRYLATAPDPAPGGDHR